MKCEGESTSSTNISVTWRPSINYKETISRHDRNILCNARKVLFQFISNIFLPYFNPWWSKISQSRASGQVIQYL